MTLKRILILQGHPDKDSLVGAFAGEYQKGAEEGGHEVRRVDLEDLKFDPILHKGYKEIQALEPDLKRVQDDILWADHIVLLFPVWWGGMPALLKGFFDRAFLPRFAYKYHGKAFIHDIMLEKLLRGKSGRIIVTMDIARIFAYLWFGRPAVEVKRIVLGFCGVAPIRISEVTPVKRMKPAEIEAWKKKIYKMGRIGV